MILIDDETSQSATWRRRSRVDLVVGGHPVLCVLGILCVGLVGCGDSGHDQTTQSSNDASMVGTRVAVKGQVRGLVGTDGLAGVTICVDGSETCVVSDDLGQYELNDVGTGRELLIRYDLADHLGATVPHRLRPTDVDIPPVSLVADALIETQFQILDVTRQPGKGLVVFGVSNGINGDGINVEGATAYLVPDPGQRAYYSSAAGLPDAALAATSTNGGGVIVNVDPGAYQIVYQSIPDTCSMRLGWGTADDARLIVEADRVTIIRIECVENP
ncbi:MAG: hypothetical protein VX589_00675 [Myxococcota bacterium]|nr:hypothetical protein [Myxococcota bacterium]